jgi:uncharacterized protein DUF2784
MTPVSASAAPWCPFGNVDRKVKWCPSRPCGIRRARRPGRSARRWLAAARLGARPRRRLAPFTPLENYLRQRGGGTAGYDGDFIKHYLLPLLYPAQLTRYRQIWLSSAAVAINVLVFSARDRQDLQRKEDQEHGSSPL